MDIEHSTMQRLAFSKYLYSLAIEQSKAPELMAAASLLTFHDAIEFFLQISAEQLNIGKDKINFMEYWEFLSKKLSISEFPQKEAMRRLNKARVALKHIGTLPSKLDVESFRSISTIFFEEATQLVFGIDFAQISLIEYVSPEAARNYLKQAVELCKQQKFDDASKDIALAFEEIIVDYEKNKKALGYGSPFDIGKDLSQLSSFDIGITHQDFPGLASFIDKTKESIEEIQKAMKIITLGLDYRKYSNFTRLLPVIKRSITGAYIINERGNSSEVDKEYIDFCINYIIECSIKLNEFDYKIEPVAENTLF